MRHRWLTALVPVVAAAGLLVPAAPAQAAAPPDSDLVLLWDRYDGVEAPHHIASLSCDEDPATGSHPDPVEACAVLDAAGGEPGLLPDDGRACPDVYDPVGGLIVGTWGGAEVFWSASFDNPCQMARFTSGVMGFE